MQSMHRSFRVRSLNDLWSMNLLQLLLILYAFCLTWTPGLGICPNVSLIECLQSSCPGGSYSCEYDSTLRISYCEPGCSNNQNRDPCTCLATYRGCHIQVNATDAVGHPTYQNLPETSYSCVNSSASTNCDYDVHVLSTFCSNGDIINWANVLSAGDVNVVLNVNGNTQTNKSLVLVLLAHYPVNWILNISSGVTIDKVLLSSFHVDVSSVTYSNDQVLSVEKVSNALLPSLANGFDANGDHTLQALTYLSDRFGSVSSFTGAARSDRFTMNIDRSSQTPECTMAPPQPTDDSQSPVISAQCHPNSPLDQSSCYINGFRPTCSGDGYCRCPNMENVDECTCLVKYGSCAVEKTPDSDNSAGKPSYRGRTQITYSCQANDNCENSVHVISTYEARSTGFSVSTGSVSVRVSVTGEDTKPLILVLTSYYPIRWSLSIPSGVVFDKVIVSSYFRYLGLTSVSYSSGAVTSVEKMSCSSTVQCYADGYDSDTVEQLQYVSNLYGPVSSWSSAYRVDTWGLNIERRSGCSSGSNTTSSIPRQSCPVIPHTTDTRPVTGDPSNPFTFSTFPADRITTRPNPFTFPTFSPSRTPFDPSSGSSNISNLARTLGSVISAVVSILVIIGIFLAVFVAVVRRRNGYSQNRTTYVQPPTVGPSRVIYARPTSSVTRTSNHVQENTAKTELTPHGTLVDSAPPAYNIALTFPQQSSNAENPPPYPG